MITGRDLGLAGLIAMLLSGMIIRLGLVQKFWPKLIVGTIFLAGAIWFLLWILSHN
jgi:hypothetical protein